jgi:hypothetical protein
MMADLDKVYQEQIEKLGSDNWKQTNPLNLPEGFHHVVTGSGEDVGFGFYCPTCKLHIVSHAPKQVRHCRMISKVPSELPTGFWFWRRSNKLETRKLPKVR